MMGGESTSEAGGHERGPQPGGREPAPGQLGLVQEFINTHYDLVEEHGAEVLASPAALAAWLERRGLVARGMAASENDLDRALRIREQLRALVREDDDATDALARLNALAAGGAVEVRFCADGPRFVAARTAGVPGALGLLLAIVATAMIDGSWSRLKICPGRDCGWAFYDHSRNRTGRWCSMSVCGGREKARAHYQRRQRRGGGR